VKPRAGEVVVVNSRIETVDADPAPIDGAHHPPVGVVADAERTAKRAAQVLAELFVRQGWISPRHE
jgi:hypothetical protein